ncbi:MAG TPA: cyclic 2,3-diphosphoglycerate synthase [Verrucomicrobiae bacterium]|nr:cyclic 2,3-diphosphoglycerate synthase [Verrucomicrobiae bacterium]
MKNILILGAAGRDFHNFNVVFRDQPDFRVVGFTAAQIPGIANRRYPPELAGRLYPEGIPIFDESELENLVRKLGVNGVVLSYSDLSHESVMHLASRTVAAGADFWLLGTEHTQLKSRVPVISVCAVRTGCGKSPFARLVTAQLRRHEIRPVVVRHPMPYGDLAAQAVQRFATVADLDLHRCTIEEREEYEPHIAQDTVVYAGVDYERILRAAEKEADVILWDGGNNDTPFYASNLEIVIADPLRAGHELGYFPGEVNLRRANVVVINKVDSASREAVDLVQKNIRAVNPKASVIEAASRVAVAAPEKVKGRRVVVVEDGPTVTHGEMAYGAGVIAAHEFGAAEIVDPRPYSVGSIRETFERFPHLTNLVPAMGYSPAQVRELEETINAIPCDLVLVATPVDLARIIRLQKPNLRVTYEIEEIGHPQLPDLIAAFVRKHAPSHLKTASRR